MHRTLFQAIGTPDPQIGAQMPRNSATTFLVPGEVCPDRHTPVRARDEVTQARKGIQREIEFQIAFFAGQSVGL
ncbi:MAG TPA: hypothetical protein VLA56_15670 [Pseudomonadales bacterium]|nr:hypothetical protein [Pseudomonadales bacterium]